MAEHLLLILAIAAGLYMAWNIGANDVANAFGTSVGSGALTFKRAVILAAIFEFSGAFLVGAHVTDTIKGQIVTPSVFLDQPEMYARGMLAALLAAGLWLNLATWLGQPVSTTHAIIGAIIGFGLVAVGPEAVQWSKMGRIAASWIVSPVFGALLAYLIYFGIRKLVLGAEGPVKRARSAVPLGLFSVLIIVLLSVAQDGLPRFVPDAGHLATARRFVWPAILVIAGLAAWLARYLVHRVPMQPGTEAQAQRERVEIWFGRLQVLTACYMSFAHGANDVANAIGPIAGILQALQGNMAAKAAVPYPVLLLGGFGIVAGLATYGYKVMEAVGRKITEVTPTRGFSAEFATATTVLICSNMGLPISTTFVLVGAVMGVGFARGFGAIDLGVVRRIFLSWLVTIPASAGLAALLYKIIAHTLP